MTRIQLTTDLSNYDFEQASVRLLYYLLPKLRLLRRVGYLLLIGGYVLAVIFRRSDADILPITTLAGITWFLMSSLTSIFVRLRFSEERQAAATRRGETTITLDDEGMHVVTSGTRFVCFWSHIEDVIDGPDGLLVLINSLQYQPIPARDLPQGTEKDQLKAQIKDWISKARQ